MTLNEHNLYETRSLWHVPFWQTALFYWISICISSVLVGILLYFILQKWRASRPKKQLTPLQFALQQINKLQQENLVQVTTAKEFYSQLSLILKHFIAQEYALPLESCTDDELIRSLLAHRFPQEFLNILHELLQGSIYIKFAQAQTAQEKIERDYAATIEFVTEVARITANNLEPITKIAKRF